MAQLEDPKLALIREIDRSRSLVSLHARGARAHANPAAKLRDSFNKNRIVWLAAAGGVTLLVGRLLMRSRTAPAQPSGPLVAAGKAGIFLGVFKFALDLAKPLLLSWVSTRLSDLAQKPPPPRPPKYY